jgi:hypothetical protein
VASCGSSSALGPGWSSSTSSSRPRIEWSSSRPRTAGQPPPRSRSSATPVTESITRHRDPAASSSEIEALSAAIGEEKPDAPEQILARWTWKLARTTRKAQDRRASSEYPEAKRLLGALANSRGHRHEENAAKLVKAALELPPPVGAALLASAEGYTPRATKLLDDAREKLGTIQEVALALSENLPAPKQNSNRNRRRRRRKKSGAAKPEAQQQATQDLTGESTLEKVADKAESAT